MELERVVRIEGRVEQVSPDESDTYFHSRPLDSRIGAWASPQSQVISGRGVLVANAAKYAAQFLLQPPRPPHWGGYRLVPDRWEFGKAEKPPARPAALHTNKRQEPGCANGWRRKSRPQGLFVAQGVNRVQPRRTTRREVPEHDPMNAENTNDSTFTARLKV